MVTNRYFLWIRSSTVRVFVIALTVLLIGIITLLLITLKSKTDDARVDVGHQNSPLLAFLYAASMQTEWENDYQLVRLGSSANVGYALLAGDIDAGFIEPELVLELKKLRGADMLEVIGKVTFPYGASLVVAKGNTARLSDLQKLRLAVAPNNRKLIAPFIADVERFGITLAPSDFKVLSSDAIIPALEAEQIDAALTSGAQAVIAQHAGHSILYQRWDLVPGDECCPAIIYQLEYLLLARKNFTHKDDLIARLKLASKLHPDSLRSAMSRVFRMPSGKHSDLPLASFEPATEEVLAIFDTHSDHNFEHKTVAIKDSLQLNNQTNNTQCELEHHEECKY